MAQKATSRDPLEWVGKTQAARATREAVAAEAAETIARQLAELIVEGDIMGGRSVAAMRLQQVAAAERRGDRHLLRAALMDASAGFAQWAAAVDFSQANGSRSSPAGS